VKEQRWAVLRESCAGQAVTFSEGNVPEAQELAAALAAFIRDPNILSRRSMGAFEAYSARNSARLLADAVDNALELSRKT